MRLIRFFQFLLFPFLASVIGATMLIDAQETHERARLIQQQPTEIQCADLIAQGPPDNNRHLKLSATKFGETYTWSNKSNSDRWSYVLIPIYPVGAVPQRDGADIRLVARICVENARELKAFLAKPEVVGCVWDSFRGQKYYDKLLREIFTEIDSDAYRVVFLGDDLPTRAQARREQFLGGGLIFAGGLLFVWLIRREWKRSRMINSNGWYAENDSRDGFYFESDAQREAMPVPPSRWATALKTWASRSHIIAIPMGGIFYVLNEFQLASEIVTTTGMGVSVLILIGGGGIFVWSYGNYAEQTYTSTHAAKLSRATRRFFDTLTSELESWGFYALGDLRVIDAARVSVRVLLSPDGKTVATLEYAFGSTAYNFFSVMPDGLLVHSCSVDLQRKLDTQMPSRCYFLANMDAASGYGQHSRCVARYLAKQSMNMAAEIEPEWITGVMDYAHRISGWALREGGYSKRGVPPLPRPDRIIEWHEGRPKFAWRAVASDVVFDPKAVEQWQAEHQAYQENQWFDNASQDMPTTHDAVRQL